MKKIMIIVCVALVATMQAINVQAKDFAYSKEKKMSNRFTVSGDEKLEVDNTYGKIHINTWDKNEVTVDITITAKAASEDEAQEVLDKISVTQGSGKRIFFKTQIGRMKSNRHEIEVNYTVNAPKKLALDLRNAYGDVYLGDYEGEMRLVVSYGAFQARSITGPRESLKISFGNASINYIAAGSISISYSNLSVEKAGNIAVDNMFGKTDIEQVQTLQLKQKYGDLDLGSVGELTADADYADVTVKNVSKSMGMVLKYCGKAQVNSIDKAADRISVNASFSNLYLTLDPGADLTANITVSYGDLSNKLSRSWLTETKQTVGGTSTRYTGKLGRGTGQMNLDVQYGNVVLR